jgi:SAM-dependent methyltransferase
MNKISSESDYRFSEGHEPHTNLLLLPHIRRYIKAIGARSMLELGCGNGAMARDLIGICPKIVGLDPSASGIEAARRNCPAGTFYAMSIYDPPEQIPDDGFEVAISTEVVEHLYYPRELLRFARKKLKEGGLFLISTPYHGWLKNVAISVSGKWDPHHDVSWDGGHIKFWSRATLGSILDK